jgi:PEP-CTERM motif
MTQISRKLGIAAVALIGAIAASGASAGTILVFGQTGTLSNFEATRVGGTTTLSADDIGIIITAIENGGVLPAFFNLTATNISDAVSAMGTITQSFAGSFTITSLAGGGGVNYLSGSFSDGVFGSGSGLTLTASTGTPGEDVTFFVGAGSPITSLGLERAISLSFTAVSPPVSICNPADPTLCAFTSNVSGNMSANDVPEPGTLALLGLGLAGLGFVGRRKQ